MLSSNSVSTADAARRRQGFTVGPRLMVRNPYALASKRSLQAHLGKLRAEMPSALL